MTHSHVWHDLWHFTRMTWLAGCHTPDTHTHAFIRVKWLFPHIHDVCHNPWHVTCMRILASHHRYDMTHACHVWDLSRVMSHMWMCGKLYRGMYSVHEMTRESWRMSHFRHLTFSHIHVYVRVCARVRVCVRVCLRVCVRVNGSERERERGRERVRERERGREWERDERERRCISVCSFPNVNMCDMTRGMSHTWHSSCHTCEWSLFVIHVIHMNK